MIINDIRKGEKTIDGYQQIKLVTIRGDVDCRYYKAPKSRKAVVWVGGVNGGWDTPAEELYPRMCLELLEQGISSLRINYRNPTEFDESVFDVLGGIQFLETEGIDVVGLVGHSLGGAVVIQAGAASEKVSTVITLATQCYGAESVLRLNKGRSILLIHGTSDELLNPYCSSYTYKLASEPKNLILYTGASHNLDEVADEVHQAVKSWIIDKLKHTLN